MANLPLLSTKNSKLNKALTAISDRKVLAAGLFLLPANVSGHNLCPEAGSCAKTCVMLHAGHFATETVRGAQKHRTDLYLTDRIQFDDQLYSELEKLERKAKRQDAQLYVRLNGSSDQDFSRFALSFPGIAFYDYTKRRDIVRRILSASWPANYSVCYSWSERAQPELAQEYLDHGHTVSVVFDTAYNAQHKVYGALPELWRVPQTDRRTYRVIDGDVHDLRHPDFDGRGRIVGLRFKGPRKRMADSIASGFTQTANV